MYIELKLILNAGELAELSSILAKLENQQPPSGTLGGIAFTGAAGPLGGGEQVSGQEVQQDTQKKPRAKKQATEEKAPETKPAAGEAQVTHSEPEIDLETLRAFLGKLSTEHKKGAQVKELIRQYGAENLTKVHPGDFGKLYADAKKLLS
jgi:hypothetical protein